MKLSKILYILSIVIMVVSFFVDKQDAMLNLKLETVLTEYTIGFIVIFGVAKLLKEFKL